MTSKTANRSPSRNRTSEPDLPGLASDQNIAIVRGTLSSDPTQRELPSGDTVHNYEVTVRSPDGPADTVPVTRFGNGRSPALKAGDAVVITGRVRRRFFRAGGVTASRTEIVAASIVPARQATRAEKSVDQALSALFDHGAHDKP
jgi:single-strand DNA-binding protein